MTAAITRAGASFTGSFEGELKCVIFIMQFAPKIA